MSNNNELQKHHNQGEKDHAEHNSKSTSEQVAGSIGISPSSYNPPKGEGQEAIDAYNKGWDNNQ